VGQEVMVTVVGSRSFGHLALDDDIPLVRVIGDLARRYGAPGKGALVLVAEDGTVVQQWMTLGQAGIRHGSRLTVQPVASTYRTFRTSRGARLRFWTA
jgi:hypothetical protein